MWRSAPEVAFWEMRLVRRRRRTRVGVQERISLNAVSQDLSGCWTEAVTASNRFGSAAECPDSSVIRRRFQHGGYDRTFRCRRCSGPTSRLRARTKSPTRRDAVAWRLRFELRREVPGLRQDSIRSEAEAGGRRRGKGCAERDGSDDNSADGSISERGISRTVDLSEVLQSGPRGQADGPWFSCARSR